jgi:hypothetical protein
MRVMPRPPVFTYSKATLAGQDTVRNWEFKLVPSVPEGSMMPVESRQHLVIYKNSNGRRQEI